ncbi:hypothetical protein BC834DRAFT_35425 [Gloeopeniophorella convolvens]|nr:hypothetical protein BC834DRAFT_35425 [Gloeopeniophorella convolvens]
MSDLIESSSNPGAQRTQHAPPSPISTLPVEALESIFFHVRTIQDRGGRPEYLPPRSDGCLSWTALSQVSRHWRWIAHGYSELWERIPLTSATWTEVALEHSKPRSIIVQWQKEFEADRRGPSPRALRLALRELHRIRVLSLEDPGRELIKESDGPFAMMLEVIRALYAQRAPLLQTLRLIGPRGFAEVYNLPRFFGGEWPSGLRTLYLEEGFVGLPLRLNSDLSSLSLEKCNLLWKSVEEMLDTLEALPNLEVLSIAKVALHGNSQPQELARPPTALHKLRSFSIFGSARSIALIMNYLSLPDGAAVRIRVSYYSGNDEEMGMLAASLNHLHSSRINARATFRHLAVIRHDAESGYDRWAATGAITFAGEPLPDVLEVIPPYGYPGFAPQLLSLLPMLASVDALEVSSRCILHLSVWLSPPGVLDTIPCVILVGPAAHDILVALTDMDTLLERWSRFPKTTDLCVRSLGVDAGHVELLRHLLGHGASSGRPLRISLEKCTVTEGLVEMLRRGYGTEMVAWDEITEADEIPPSRERWTMFW